MAVTLSNLTSKVRYLIGDNSISSVPGDIFTYTDDNVFSLSESNGVTVTAVYKNNVEMGTSETTYDSSTGKVTINLTMLSGDTVEVQFTYYANYSSTEIQSYIQAALVHLSANNYKTWVVRSSTVFPEPDEDDQNLICMITSLLIEPDNKTYRLPDVSVVVPKDLPVHEKIRRTISIYKYNSHGIFSGD